MRLDSRKNLITQVTRPIIAPNIDPLEQSSQAWSHIHVALIQLSNFNLIGRMQVGISCFFQSWIESE